MIRMLKYYVAHKNVNKNRILFQYYISEQILRYTQKGKYENHF